VTSDLHPFTYMRREVRPRWVWQIAIALLSCLILYCAGGVALGQAVHPVTGRRIAPVMGVSGADWLDREDREREERPAKAIAELGLSPGMTVGDVGAGTGFYSIRIAKQVAPHGIVYANDIQPGMLARLRANAEAQNVHNVETVLGTESDPHLPIGKLDLVVMVDVYHELSRPQRMLDRIRESLKPEGRLVLLEFRKEDSSIPIRPEHKMSVDEVRAEVTPQGYQFDKVVDTLPWQHIIFFHKTY
jgi:ubiquinone/menaquinone biosynthesis C-methylase UbiE